MKRKTAKELLAESFWELAEEKPIGRITVGEIVRNCGYSTATFYRHFKDKYDLIVWAYAQTVADTMNQIGIDGYPWKQTLLEGAKLFMENRNVLANLMLHTSGYDAFISHMTEINYRALKAHILKSSGQTELDEKTDMYVRMYCMGTVCLTSEWILGKYRITPEELATIYENCLPLPLHPYLLQTRE